jgi:uncharacterized membrane protein
MMPSRGRRALGLAALLTVTGTLHFAVPAPFIAIVPARSPHKATLVAVSGLAELASATLLAVPSTRSTGGVVAAATLVAVFPANISMALRSTGRRPAYRIAAWARLLQVPLVAWALSVVGRHAGG